ncbi:MAG: hypothetical protein ABI867_20640 [Kofleriaceae bacterium]
MTGEPNAKQLWIPIGGVVGVGWIIALALVIKGDGADHQRETLSRMTELADRMCECRTKSCADNVQEDLTKWAQDEAKTETKKSRKDDKALAELTRESSKIMSRYSECMAKLMMPQ